MHTIKEGESTVENEWGVQGISVWMVGEAKGKDANEWERQSRELTLSLGTDLKYLNIQ